MDMTTGSVLRMHKGCFYLQKCVYDFEKSTFAC